MTAPRPGPGDGYLGTEGRSVAELGLTTTFEVPCRQTVRTTVHRQGRTS